MLLNLSTISAEQKAVRIEAALAALDSQAEQQAAALEQMNIQAVNALHAQMVAVVRTQHDKECERLENDLQYNKDKRVKELKSRLERKKAERAKEILAASDGKQQTSSLYK